MISVIIPIYNSSQTLKKCLDAVFSNKFKKFEVIVISDNSEDDSIDIAKNYNCKIIEFRQNKGPAFARNAGANSASNDILLFVDSDVEFSHEAVLRMLVPEKDIVVTPYRLKENPLKFRYPVEHLNPNNIKILPFDLVELKSAPAGLMLIKKIVFEKLMDKHPELKIEFDDDARKKMNAEIGSMEDAIKRYMYNFWDTTFSLKTGEWKGEDLSFCALATDSGSKIYANLDSETTHHGSYGWKGRFGDSLVKSVSPDNYAKKRNDKNKI